MLSTLVFTTTSFILVSTLQLLTIPCLVSSLSQFLLFDSFNLNTAGDRLLPAIYCLVNFIFIAAGLLFLYTMPAASLVIIMFLTFYSPFPCWNNAVSLLPAGFAFFKRSYNNKQKLAAACPSEIHIAASLIFNRG